MQTMAQIGPSKNPRLPIPLSPYLPSPSDPPSTGQPHISISLSLSCSHARIERGGAAPLTAQRIRQRSWA